MLSFDLWNNDFDGGPVINPAGLTHTSGPNQHSRVDIMSAGATPFDTGAGVLGTPLAPFAHPFLGAPNPWVHYMFDITGLTGGGGTFKIRFGEVDNLGFNSLAVDNVSVLATAAAVPEPSTLVLMLTSGILTIGYRRYNGKKS